MPLYRRKRVPLVPMPEIQEGEEDQPCWMIRFTGETFKSYEPVWQCEHTGKQCLTYEQALESEQRSRRAVEERLPSRGLRRAILKLVQFQTSRIDNLVDEAYQKLQHRFFADEPVNYHAEDGVVHSVRIVQVLPRRSRTSLQHILNDVPMPSPPPDELDVVDASEVEYRVRLIDAFGSEPVEYTVDGTYLSRNRQTFTKQLLRQFIRDAATKENYVNAPWLVKPEIARMYGITTQLPPALLAQREEAARKKAKKKSHGIPFPIEDRSDARAASEKRALEDSKASPEKKFKEDESAATVKIKYPIEDLELLSLSSTTSSTTRAPPPKVTPVPDAWFHDLFETWCFLCTFNTALSLSSFSLEDFRMATLHDTLDPLCRLTAATYAALLRCAAADRDILLERLGEFEEDDEEEEDEEETGDEGKSRNGDGDTRDADGDANMTDATMSNGDERNGVKDDVDPLSQVELCDISENWWINANEETDWEARLVGCLRELANEETLPGYTEITRHLISIGTSPEDIAECYVTLRPDQKLAIQRWLVNLVVDGSVIRQCMDQRSEKVTELRKERVDISRELKKITLQRAEMDAQANTDGENSSVNGEREGTPLSAMDIVHDSDEATGLTARQAKLRAKNLERELKEARRQRELDRAREEQRNRRRLDEEERIFLRKREKLDREIGYCLAIRALPLGYDRWYRRYWFIPSIGGQDVANTGDRIYIQPPLEDELAALENSDPVVKAQWETACAEQHANRWSYLNTEAQFEQLQTWLDPRGERELALRRALEKQRDAILEAIEEYQQRRQRDQQDDEGSTGRTAEISRRSLRSRTIAISNEPYLKYVNRESIQH